MKIKDRLILITLMVLLTPCCIKSDVDDTTTTILPDASSTTSIPATDTTAETTSTTSTTSTTISSIIITTTTTTTTIIIYNPTTTIENAKCYINSDCGEQKIEYYCKVELIDDIQPTRKGETVYRVIYVPICKDPGTPWAECIKIRKERDWDECQEYEECIPGCHVCVPIDERCPKT